MVKFLFFAHLKDKVGESELEIDVAGMSLAEVKELLLKRYKIDTAAQSIMLAINETYVTDDVLIEAGDVVALIPPVSGG